MIKKLKGYLPMFRKTLEHEKVGWKMAYESLQKAQQAQLRTVCEVVDAYCQKMTNRKIIQDNQDKVCTLSIEFEKELFLNGQVTPEERTLLAMRVGRMVEHEINTTRYFTVHFGNETMS